MNRNENQTPNTTNVLSFIVPLTHDAATNQTAIFDRLSKQTSMGNDHKYQHITKILNNSRETINKCMMTLSFSIFDFIFVFLDECSLYPLIVELASCLPVPSISNYST